MVKISATVLVVAMAAGYVRAQSGLAVAMYVPHDLQTLNGTVQGTWKGSFEAPLTTNLRGQKADWAAFCVDSAGSTCFSEPVSEITAGNYTVSGEVIEFEVTGIPAPTLNGPGVVCYVATVFDKGQICSKPVLNYEEIGPVSNGNFNWAAVHSDANRGLADNPIIARVAEAAKETVQMVQTAFGDLQAETAKEIEDNVEAFNATELHQLLADEIGAVAELFRPEAEAPAEEAPAVPEVYGTAIVTPLNVPAVEAPTVEAAAVEAPTVEATVVPEVYGTAIVTPLNVPAVEAPTVEAPTVEAPVVPEVYGTAIVTPLTVPSVEAPSVEVPPVEVSAAEAPAVPEVYGTAIVTPLAVPAVEAPAVEAPAVEAPVVPEVYGTAIVTPLDVPAPEALSV